MTPQNIATKANANHFGHPDNNSVKAAPQKNRISAAMKSLAANVPENKPTASPADTQKSAPSPKSNSAAAPTPQPAAALHESPNETVFRFEAPTAHSVLLAGDFSDWEKSPIKMIKGGGGVWHAKVLLARGRHQYRFVVDGEWQNDPNQPHHVPNSFGGFNNVVEIH